MPQTEYEFTLPRGYVDDEGNVHKEGVMRLATAADEIEPFKDPRVRDNPQYLSIIILSRVIVKLGDLESVSIRVIEGLFTADLSYLQDVYQKINGEESHTTQVTCPNCGKKFTAEMYFER